MIRWGGTIWPAVTMRWHWRWPDSLELLGALAASLERQGNAVEARAVRDEIAARRAVTAPSPAVPADPPPAPALAPDVAGASEAAGPRLQRVSPQEVVLVTEVEPQWQPQLVDRTARSTTVRFVPLREAGVAETARLRLLNAAGRPGLAGATRTLLAGRGWRDIRIGDAPRVRQASLILYPPAQRAAAERLAVQIRFPLRRQAAGREIVVLLGRDAVAPRSGQAG